MIFREGDLITIKSNCIIWGDDSGDLYAHLSSMIAQDIDNDILNALSKEFDTKDLYVSPTIPQIPIKVVSTTISGQTRKMKTAWSVEDLDHGCDTEILLVKCTGGEKYPDCWQVYEPALARLGTADFHQIDKKNYKILSRAE